MIILQETRMMQVATKMEAKMQATKMQQRAPNNATFCTKQVCQSTFGSSEQGTEMTDLANKRTKNKTMRRRRPAAAGAKPAAIMIICLACFGAPFATCSQDQVKLESRASNSPSKLLEAANSSSKLASAGQIDDASLWFEHRTKPTTAQGTANTRQDGDAYSTGLIKENGSSLVDPSSSTSSSNPSESIRIIPVSQGTHNDNDDGGSNEVTRRHHIERRYLQQQPAQQQASNQQQPKLVQWSREPVQYFEGSTLVLSCSLAMSWQPTTTNNNQQLKFQWLKQAKALVANQNRLSIDTVADYSFLRLTDLRASDSGAYTCAVSTGPGGAEDRTTAHVIVNVKLHWLPSSRVTQSTTTTGNEPPGFSLFGRNTTNAFHFANGNLLETARGGQPVDFECAAASQPGPRIRWFKLVPRPVPKQVGKQGGHRQPPDGAVRVDESSVRSFLMQPSDHHHLLASFHALELPLAQHAIMNQNKESHESTTSRWRVESAQTSHLASEPLESRSRLYLDRADSSQAGLYACEAESHNNNNNNLASQAGGLEAPLGPDRLRRLFGLLVNGK